MLTAILRGPTRASFVHYKLLQLQKSIWSTLHLLCPQWESDLISSSSKQQHAPHQLGKEKCLSFQRDEHTTGTVPVASKCRYCTHRRSCRCKVYFKIERWTPLLCPSAQVEAMGGGSAPLYTELSIAATLLWLSKPSLVRWGSGLSLLQAYQHHPSQFRDRIQWFSYLSHSGNLSEARRSAVTCVR